MKCWIGYGQEEFHRKMETKIAKKEYFRDKNLNWKPFGYGWQRKASTIICFITVPCRENPVKYRKNFNDILKTTWDYATAS